MKKMLLVGFAAAAAAVAFAAIAAKRPIEQPDQPDGTWELASERTTS